MRLPALPSVRHHGTGRFHPVATRQAAQRMRESCWTRNPLLWKIWRVLAPNLPDDAARSAPTCDGERRRALGNAAAKHLAALARCLTGPVLRQLHETGRSAFLTEAYRKASLPEHLGHGATLLASMQAIFDLVSRQYRSDYVYRTAIANKIFLGRHSPATTTLLSELRIWRCRADLVMLNGTSTAYEIKTELDNLDRLTSQIDAYSRVFDRIYVVSHTDHVTRLLSDIPDFVGLITLSKSFTLQVAREASSNADKVHIPTILDALRRGELVEMTRRVCGSVPRVNSVQLVKECARLVEEHGRPRQVHDEMVTLLKRRRNFVRQDFEHVPSELLPAYLESGVAARDWSRLTDFLTNTRIEEIVY